MPGAAERSRNTPVLLRGPPPFPPAMGLAMTPLILAAILGVLGLICVALLPVGLPGTWMVLGLAAILELADPWLVGPDVTSVGWAVIGAGLLLAIIGEAIEFGSGVVGAKAGGGSTRGAWGAFWGGLLGAIVGSFVVPVVGTILGALLGTFGGAWVGETTGEAPRDGRDAITPAFTATLARVVAIVAKTGIGVTVWLAVTSSALYYAWPS